MGIAANGMESSMLASLRAHLTYANVMATIAVLIALSGGAYAAGLVGPNDIAKDAVRTKHIKNGNLKVVDAQPRAFGRGIQFGGVQSLVGAPGAYFPVGLNTDFTALGAAAPVPMRIRDFWVELDFPATGGTRNFALGVVGESAKQASCTITAGSPRTQQHCTDKGPTAILQPGDRITVLHDPTNAQGFGGAAFSWRATPP
jgi:hypothetical protein